MRRILVVDDDPHVYLAIRAWLKRYGFKVAIADGGDSGLRALDNSTFDLMIVDIFMPEYARFQIDPGVSRSCADGAADRDFRLRLLRPGQASPDFLRMALRLGATRCLRKPFRPTTLLSVIDQCLSEAEPHRRHVATLSRRDNARSEQSSHEPREDVFAD